MLLGYNTNGMAHHDLFDAVELLADIGYQSVAITIDHTALAPHSRYNRQQTQRLRLTLQRRKMRSVIETGARFLLDPREKHEPTLVSRDADGRRRRIDFYKYAVDSAAELQSDCVSLWSGRLPADVDRSQALAWLVAGLCKSSNMPPCGTCPWPSSPSRACSSIRWTPGKSCWPNRAWTISA